MITTKPVAVLVTGAGTVTCQSVIKALRSQDELDVTIVTVDASDNVAGRYFSDVFYRVPKAHDSEFVPVLASICRQHDIRLLVPIVDYEFEPLSRARSVFESLSCRLSLSPLDALRVTNDKRATYCFFRQHGFDTPATWTATEALERRGELPYPVFVKPAVDGRSSIDCYKVDNEEDLTLHIDRIPGLIVQEFVDGPEFTADALADFDSSVIGIVVRERIETKGGVSYKGVTVKDDWMAAEVSRMVGILGLVGPINVQAFRSGDRLIFNEINPRFSGALALSLAAGFNSPLLLLKVALGRNVTRAVTDYETGLTMLRYWDEIFVDSQGRPIFPQYDLCPPLDNVTVARGAGRRVS